MQGASAGNWGLFTDASFDGQNRLPRILILQTKRAPESRQCGRLVIFVSYYFIMFEPEKFEPDSAPTLHSGDSGAIIMTDR